MTRVRCYAGASYPERPLAFEWEGRWIKVAEITRQTRTPKGLQFAVVTEEGQQYRLSWTEQTDEWQLDTPQSVPFLEVS